MRAGKLDLKSGLSWGSSGRLIEAVHAAPRPTISTECHHACVRRLCCTGIELAPAEPAFPSAALCLPERLVKSVACLTGIPAMCCRQKHRERAIRMKSLLAAENVGGIAGEGAEMPTSPYSDRG